MRRKTRSILKYLGGIMLILLLWSIFKIPFLLNSQITTGVVIDYKKSIGSVYSIVQYEINGHLYEHQGPENVLLDKGKQVSLRYDPRNPEKARFNNAGGLFIDTKLAIASLLILLWTALFFSFLPGQTSPITSKPVYQNFFSIPNLRKHNRFLIRHSSYFKNLHPKNKIIYLKRMHQFILSKSYINEYEEKAEKSKVLIIAAAQTQVTFGFNHYLLPSINTCEIIQSPAKQRQESNIKETKLKINEAIFTKPLTIALKLDLAIKAIITELYHMYSEKMLDEPELEKIFAEWEKKQGHHVHQTSTAIIKPLQDFLTAPRKLYAQNPEEYKTIGMLFRQDPLSSSKKNQKGITGQRFAC